MKVFYRPVIDGEYGPSVRLEDKPDNEVYELAHKMYPNDPDYVSECLDGKGYIFIQGSDGMFTYQQDSL